MTIINIYEPISQSLTTLDEQLHKISANSDDDLGLQIINSTACQILSVQMPVKQAKQIIKALPFALEEQLANDIDQNHIHYLGKENGEAHALIVSHDLMTSVVNTNNPDGLFYLPLLLPQVEKGICVCVLDDIANIRFSKFGAMSVSIDILPLVIERLKNDEREVVEFHDLDEKNELLSLELENIGFKVIKGEASTLHAHLINQLKSANANLLSGSYQKRKPKNTTKINKFKAPLALAAVLLVAMFVTQLKELNQYKQMGDLVSNASKSFYTNLFPDERVRSLRRQFKDKLEETGGATTINNGFVNLLASTTKGINESGGAQWDAVRYTGKKNEIEVNLIVKNVAQLDGIKQKLASSGLQVDITSATEVGSQIKGVLKVKQNG
ncbi:hypothetical protein NBRC116188_01620 [Oceaniserpentilla sp. 4NH20-0058]|uniref:type II secretion system protein GspL n=1 Tax=Oceaniserpentilla sp. 4NH20-0058 TaxID=3127660 RepID=UPI00310516D9